MLEVAQVQEGHRGGEVGSLLPQRRAPIRSRTTPSEPENAFCCAGFASFSPKRARLSTPRQVRLPSDTRRPL
jgi:hypothetical protein